MLFCHPDILFGKISVQTFCPFLKLVVCFLIIELSNLYSDISGKYFLPAYGSSFYSINCVIQRAKVNFFSFMDHSFWWCN